MTTNIPYGYKKSETNKDVWEVDEEAAQVIRKIFKMCISGMGSSKIARTLDAEGILIPTAYAHTKGKCEGRPFKKATRWTHQTVNDILERIEYVGHTVNFRSYQKSYKNKKRIENSKED